MNAMLPTTESSIALKSRVVCPNCWEGFSPDAALWIAQHPDLLGDPRLGADHPQRFLPTRFDLSGAAIDAKGFPCHELACPKCHLRVPRACFELDSFFLSILGNPACGKSFFIAAMTWRLRTLLSKEFALSFVDADALLNYRLQQNESRLFLNPEPNALVNIDKTETTGDLYYTVNYGGQSVQYLRPFIFSVHPLEWHPLHERSAKAGKVVCLYDNAGESFLPGAETASSPVTRHLAASRAILFLFDPTQDLRYRHLCQGKTTDPQMVERSQRMQRESAIRQETILVEAAQRARRFAGLPQNAKHRRPLIVVVTKYDAWSALLGPGRLRNPWRAKSDGTISAVCYEEIAKMSQHLRELLRRVSPEIVAAAEGFANEVLYVPISATGCGPEIDPLSNAQGFRPKNLKPMWVEVPLLYLMCRHMGGLVGYWREKEGKSRSNVPGEGVCAHPTQSLAYPSPPPTPSPASPPRTQTQGD